MHMSLPPLPGPPMQESDAAHALTNLHIRLHQSMEDKLVGFQKHLRREFLWKKLLYGSTPGRTEEVVRMVSLCGVWCYEM